MSETDRKRDIELIRKVSGLYLQYRGIFDIEKLLSTFQGTNEIPVDDYTLSYIYNYILYVITKDIVKAAEDAKRDRLTYREFTVEYSTELYGTLCVDRTIPVYHMGLVAYYNFTEGYNAPEYAIFGYLLRRIYSIIKNKREKFKIYSPLISYFDFSNEFDKYFEKLGEIKDNFPIGYYRDPIYTDPKWLITAYKAYFLAKNLENIRIGERTSRKSIDKKRLIEVILWKLYELYIFYLVAQYLESKGYIIRKEGDSYIAEKNGQSLQLIFNASLPQYSSLRRVDKKENTDAYRGKPDISIIKNKPIIFECKYSTNVSYITAGRFKIMAYTYEYDPLIAVLVYPGLNNEDIDFDQEDSATRELDNLAKSSGLLNFQYNNHVLYMAIIDPLHPDEYNLIKISSILEKYI